MQLKRRLDVNRQQNQVSFGKNIPFIHVAFDGWDRKKKEALGITIFFHDNQNHEQIIPLVGMVKPKGKTPLTIARQVHDLLFRRLGISKTHILSCINDTTNSAVAASRLIADTGEKGTCEMHVYELVQKHMTGQVKRTLNKIVVDKFTACVELWFGVCVKVTVYLMNGKVKGLFNAYSMHNKGQVLQLDLPNERESLECSGSRSSCFGPTALSRNRS
jgi:hypothetical protein